jgi:hypothetical protein
MLAILQSANLILRLLVELGVLVAVFTWAASLPFPYLARVASAIATPLLLAWTWAVLLSPGSSVPIPEVSRTILQLCVFAIAALALVGAGRPNTAIVFGTVAVANAALMTAWNQ